MFKKITLPTVLLVILCSTSLLAQTRQPEVGKPMPDFQLNAVEHFHKSKVSQKDFRGKWLLLDFWYRGCSSSANSLPKMDSIQRLFNDKLQVLIVAMTGKMFFGKGIKPLFEKLTERQNLSLPVAYDSVLSKKWGIYSFPNIIMIDPKGIVYEITAGQDMTIDKIRRLVDGEKVSFSRKLYDRPEFNADSISNYKDKLIYRSTFTKWEGESQFIPGVEEYLDNFTHNGIKIARTNLASLYNIAFFGKEYWGKRLDSALYFTTYPNPIIEVKDKSPFEFNFLTGKSIYNYQLDVRPEARNPVDIMRIMRTDLKNIFGFEATVEMRDVKVWKLIASPDTEKKLKTKGATPYSANFHNTGDNSGDAGLAGFFMVNYPFQALKNILLWYINPGELPLFDETGIDYKIDFTMDALMTDLNQINRELGKYGIKLIQAHHKLKVVVIKDVVQ